MTDALVASVAVLARALAGGKTTSRRLVEEALARIADANGEGGRAFTKVHARDALLAGEASDRLRSEGVVPSPLAGLPVSIKDLFDIAGDVTTAGSKILRDRSPAAADAVAVARLRAAGAVVIGRSSMTEFAFSGIGINPHYGTPANPYDRGVRRIPGGSSSGAAVSVSDGMAAFALGTDTGGSVRIPAALCGVTGFKPTTSRVPREGRFRCRQPWIRSGRSLLRSLAARRFFRCSQATSRARSLPPSSPRRAWACPRTTCSRTWISK